MRFNFRGVGQSQGAFGGGILEQEDVRAALRYIRSLPAVDSAKIGLAGYSFGAAMVLSAALGDEGVRHLALVSPMTSDVTFEQLQRFAGSKLVILGESDTMLPVSRFQQYADESAGTLQCQIVPGADHFWSGYEGELTTIILPFFVSGFSCL
jgi:alpha/beta superfamily hydrolase